MALYQRGRIWYADYYADGKRVQESTGTANRREAEKFIALRVSEVHRGVFVKPVHTTLPELGDRYIEYAKMHKRSWLRDEQMLAKLKAFFGPARLREITALRVEEYRLDDRSRPCPRQLRTGKWPCLSICSIWRNGGDSITARIRCAL